jgi:hypothetical protein
MAKKPTAQDAELILRLYELRREPEMRKARTWVNNNFWPRSAEDFIKVGNAPGTQENAWLRQVSGYWGIAASFVQAGVLSEELFLKPGCSGEMFLYFAKLNPFIKELRERLSDPDAFLDIEKVIKHTKWGRDRLAFIEKRLEIWREKLEKKPTV